MVQRSSPKAEKTQQEIQTGLLRAYEQVGERSRRNQISLRTAAYAIAIERVARCERLRVALSETRRQFTQHTGAPGRSVL